MIDRKLARGLSRIGVRATYGQALYELGQANDSIVAMSADLGRSSGLNQFSLNLPKQFVNVGISEQNMIGVAAGMASQGKIVFASSFAPFISMRASEQVRMNLGYMKWPVKLVALGSGVAMAFLGNSHFGLEDVAVMRAIPGMTIVSPADCVEVKKVLEAAVEWNGPMYIRLTGAVNAPIVYQDEYNFEIGKADILREGEVTIVASGTSVALALSVAKMFEEQMNLNVGVINMHTIKPLDLKCLEKVFNTSSLVVSLEEHTIIGGLGSAISDAYSEHGWKSKFAKIGLPDKYVPTGEYSYVLDEVGLNSESVFKSIKKLIG